MPNLCGEPRRAGPEEGACLVDEKAELLGIFTVNLRRALDPAPTSETGAGAKD
jgi:hypothetical protein